MFSCIGCFSYSQPSCLFLYTLFFSLWAFEFPCICLCQLLPAQRYFKDEIGLHRYSQVPTDDRVGTDATFGSTNPQALTALWVPYSKQALGAVAAAFVKHLLDDWPEGDTQHVQQCGFDTFHFISSFNQVHIPQLSDASPRPWSWGPRLKEGSLSRPRPVFWTDCVTLHGAVTSTQAVTGSCLASSMSLISMSPSCKTWSHSFSRTRLFSRCFLIICISWCSCLSGPDPSPRPRGRHDSAGLT